MVAADAASVNAANAKANFFMRRVPPCPWIIPCGAGGRRQVMTGRPLTPVRGGRHPALSVETSIPCTPRRWSSEVLQPLGLGSGGGQSEQECRPLLVNVRPSSG